MGWLPNLMWVLLGWGLATFSLLVAGALLGLWILYNRAERLTAEHDVVSSELLRSKAKVEVVAADLLERSAALKDSWSELDSAKTLAAGLEGELDVKNSQIAALEQTIECHGEEFAQLKGLLLVSEARLLVLEAASEMGASDRDVSLPVTRYDEGLPGWLEQMAEHRETAYNDDLQQVAGIGPVIERRLLDVGISNLFLLSSLSEDQHQDRSSNGLLEELSSRIQVSVGRIRREDWIGQADSLHFQKYGNELGSLQPAPSMKDVGAL